MAGFDERSALRYPNLKVAPGIEKTRAYEAARTKQAVKIRLPFQDLDALDALRGETSRAAYVERVLKKHLKRWL